MSDDFLHVLREQASPEFAGGLQQRLAAQDRRHRKAQAATLQIGGVCAAACCLVIALNLGTPLQHAAPQAPIGVVQTEVIGSELIPVSQMARFDPPLQAINGVHIETVDDTLKASVTAISHHHQ